VAEGRETLKAVLLEEARVEGVCTDDPVIERPPVESVMKIETAIILLTCHGITSKPDS
jgi:hypothetical protein